MNVTAEIFQKVGSIFTSAKARRDAEYADFFAFYRSVIEETDTAVATAIGRTAVDVLVKGKVETWGIELTVADYVWWVDRFEQGIRFTFPMAAVKAAILKNLAKAAEINGLTADERKSLIALMCQPSTPNNSN